MTITIDQPLINERLAQLRALLAALGDGSGRHCRSDMERAAYRRNYDTIQGCISVLMNVDDLQKPTRLLAEWEARRTAVLAKQAELETAITDAPNWRTFATGRERDREYDRQASLKLQLRMLHEGTLLCAPGVTFERLADLDVRIEELNTRIARLRARIDSHLETAARLLGDQPVATPRVDSAADVLSKLADAFTETN